MTQRSRHPLCYVGREHKSFGEKSFARAVAIVSLKGGSTFFTCKRDLDKWLDCADDNPDLEPVSLVWIK